MKRLLWLALMGFVAAAQLLAQEPRLLDSRGGHTGDVLCVAFSPDGKTLASGRGGNKIHLWDTGTGKSTTLLNANAEYASPAVVFSPDGKTLASGGRCIFTIKLWDVATGRNTGTLGERNTIQDVASMTFTADGKALAVAYSDGRIKLWDPAAGKSAATVKEGDAEGFTARAFRPDGKVLAAVVHDKTLNLWTLELWDVGTDEVTYK